MLFSTPIHYYRELKIIYIFMEINHGSLAFEAKLGFQASKII